MSSTSTPEPEPPAKKRRESLAQDLLGELSELENQNEILELQLKAAREEAEQATSGAAQDIAAAKAEADAAKDEAKHQMDKALEIQLSVLPHCNRYTRAGNTTLAADDPLRKRLEEDFQDSLTRHRGPKQGDPHRSTPKLEVMKIERICVPRLQEKYFVELQDIARLCEQKVTTPGRSGKE